MQVNAAVDWLYADGEKAPLAEYQQKLTDFQAVAEPVKARYRYYSTVQDFIGQFDAVKAKIESQAAELPYEERKQSIAAKVAVAAEFIGKV